MHYGGSLWLRHHNQSSIACRRHHRAVQSSFEYNKLNLLVGCSYKCPFIHFVTSQLSACGLNPCSLPIRASILWHWLVNRLSNYRCFWLLLSSIRLPSLCHSQLLVQLVDIKIASVIASDTGYLNTQSFSPFDQLDQARYLLL